MRRDCIIILPNFGILLMTRYSSDYLDCSILVHVVLEFHYVSETFKYSIENVFLLSSHLFLINARERHALVTHFCSNRALEITESSFHFKHIEKRKAVKLKCKKCKT